MNAPFRVVIADDHPIVARGLERLLEASCLVLASVSDGEALVEASSTLLPDLAITDIAMPRLNGLEATRRITGLKLPVKVIVMTMHADPFIAAEAFRAGAAGFVLKDSGLEEILESLHVVAGGGRFLSAAIEGGEIWRLLDLERHSAGARPTLTSRQQQILQLVAQGHSMKKIALELGISSRTAESHKQSAMRSLNLRSTADIVRYAIAVGVVEAAPLSAEFRRPSRKGRARPTPPTKSDRT